MNRDEIKQLAQETLCEVAPDIEPGQLDPELNIRDQYDFDSMDLLNFVIALYRTTQLEIPEKDYGQLQSLNNIVDYLSSRMVLK